MGYVESVCAVVSASVELSVISVSVFLGFPVVVYWSIVDWFGGTLDVHCFGCLLCDLFWALRSVCSGCWVAATAYFEGNFSVLGILPGWGVSVHFSSDGK